MVKAYSYVRFSTPEQMRGDSFRRQTEAARDYALKNGLELDDKLTFHDKGISAYRGRNTETGRLGDFLEAVEKGLVPRGSYLLIESLDRISRQAARKAMSVLGDICDRGDITIVTMSDGRTYNTETLDNDTVNLLVALLIFIRSNEESVTKGRRLKEAWANKRRKAVEAPLTARCPAWLTLGADRKWIVNEQKADVVRKVYLLASLGHGQNYIAETLNRDGVSTFGDGARPPGRHWYRSYVARILDNPAVIGTYVPFTLDYEGGRKKRTAQAPVANYFPAIVDLDLYERVRASTMDKVSSKRGRHARAEVQNVLGGLAKCPDCRGSMTRVSKGAKAKAGKPYLVCAKAKAGAGCNYRAVRLEGVERCLRENAAIIVQRVPAPVDGSDLQEKLTEVEINKDATSEAIQRLLQLLMREPSPALRAQLREAEAGLDKLNDDEKALWDRIATTNGPLIDARLAELEEVFETETFKPSAVNLALRRLLSSVVVNYRTGNLELEWLHGGRSEYTFGWPQDD